jgi:anti-sigma B factor antagonist
MSMKAQIRTDSIGNITVHMRGGLNYENSVPFRQELEELIVENPKSVITLDMHFLDFVGSSGISTFVETIKELNLHQPKIRLSNVKKEFIRVFKLYNLEMLDSIIDDFENEDLPHPSLITTPGRRPFEN